VCTVNIPSPFLPISLIMQVPPKQVRATEAFYDHSDPNHLTYKNGELIYVIDR